MTESRSSGEASRAPVDLSVVIVTWNTRELTLDCLAATRRALAAEVPRAEIVMVDNGSRDGTAAAVAERFPDVRRVVRGRNGGFGRGANTGLRRARGRHWLLLNSDARPLAGALATCMAYLDAHPSVGLLGPRLVRPDGRAERSAHPVPRVAGEWVPPALHPWVFGVPAPRGAGGPVCVEAVRGAALFVRAEAARRVGLLPEHYFFFLEETEWCWRMGRAGWQVVHHPGAAFVHASGASSKRLHPSATRIEYNRSLDRFYRRHATPAAAAAARGLRLAKSALHVVAGAPAAALSPRRRARWRSHRDVLRWQLRGRPDSEGLATVEDRP